MMQISDVLAVVLVGTLAGILAPESRGEGYRKLVRMIVGLSLILVIADTALSSAEKIRGIFVQLEENIAAEWSRGEEIRRESEEWVTERGIRNVEEGAAALVRARFSLAGEVQVTAACSVDAEGTVSIDSLRIRIDAEDGASLREMETYLSGLLSCPCYGETAEGREKNEEAET